MLLIMCVSLYAVRVVLSALGEEDYGINNVVAGVVTMFSFLTNTLASASQRFFAFELGKNNISKLKQYFGATFFCYFLLALIFILIAETLGMWFVKEKMTIPTYRMSAALFIYQVAIITFIVKLFVIPYMSVIMAREQMNIYAVVSIVEVVMQLLSAFIIQECAVDRLKLYSVLLLLSSLFPSICFVLFSIKKFPEARINLLFSKSMLYELVSYSGWNLIGTLSGILRSQGINILLNTFFTPIVNAARGIAYQVNSAVNQLSNSFFNAVKPQITKTFAAGESEDMMDLVFVSSRFCFYLIWVLSLPLLLETDLILNIWLKEVPEYTIMFTRLVLINAIIDGLAHPLMSAVQATGNIKCYQIVTGGLLLLTLPVSYVFLLFGYPPQITMVVSIVVSIIAQCVRIFFVNSQLKMKISKYGSEVLWRIFIVSVLSILLPCILHFCIKKTVLRFFIVLGVSIFSNISVIWYWGCNSKEKNVIKTFVKQLRHENFRKFRFNRF